MGMPQAAVYAIHAYLYTAGITYKGKVRPITGHESLEEE
jgi:hypothetical protein